MSANISKSTAAEGQWMGETASLPSEVPAPYAATLPAAPAPTRKTLAQRVAAAQAEMASWSPGVRASVRLEGGDAAAPTEQAELKSIATNHDAMIILTQDYTREQKIMAVDAHMRRELTALAARQAPTASDNVPIPKSVEQAQLMANLGLMWLRDHAPEKLVVAPDSRDAARWQPITRAGQVKVGDKLRFNLCGDAVSVTAKLILNAGTDKEEIIYNKTRNYYLITSMTIAGKGSQKNVEVLAQEKAQ